MALSVRIDGTWLYNVRHHGEIDLVFYEYLGKMGLRAMILIWSPAKLQKYFQFLLHQFPGFSLSR